MNATDCWQGLGLPRFGTIVLGIDDLGLAQQRSHLSLELPFAFEHALMAHGLVLTGIGFHLGAIQCNLPQAHQPGLSRELVAE
jgi:hypothetical protein